MKSKTEINTQFVFTENNQVLIHSDKEDKWFPINFQWIPVIKLNKIMQQ